MLLCGMDNALAHRSERPLSHLELGGLRRTIPRPNDKETTEWTPRTPAQIIGEAFALHDADLTSPLLQPYRIRVGYRLAREFARHLGLIRIDEALSAVDIARWSQPRPPLSLPTGPFCPSVRFLLEEVKQMPQRYGVDEEEAGPCIMPPTPENLRHIWCKCMLALADFLGIEHGSPIEPHYGRLGTLGLLTPDYSMVYWPSVISMCQYEAILVDEIIDALIRDGAHHVHKGLYATHGFALHEARGLVKLAQLEMAARTDTDIEMDKAQLTIRLEDLVLRAREACDQRVELGAIKQLSIIRGVTRAEPEDVASEFARVVKRVSNAAAPQLENGHAG